MLCWLLIQLIGIRNYDLQGFVLIVVMLIVGFGTYAILLSVFESIALRPSEKVHAASDKVETSKRADSARWFLTFIVWLVGAGIIGLIWYGFRDLGGIVGGIGEFVSYIVAFFYFLALMPIRIWIGQWLGDKDPFDAKQD